MNNEIPLPYYLQQHEITKSQPTNFSRMPHAAESLQMTIDYESIPNGWIINIIKSTTIGIHRHRS